MTRRSVAHRDAVWRTASQLQFDPAAPSTDARASLRDHQNAMPIARRIAAAAIAARRVMTDIVPENTKGLGGDREAL